MDRNIIYSKYNGRCAYTGKPLNDDWQIDHCISKRIGIMQGINFYDISNLMPTLRIVNHYKRALDLEGFRKYMACFHNRLAKLPKITNSAKTINRIKYMNEVADAFDIAINKPFSGVFFFEMYETYKIKRQWNT